MTLIPSTLEALRSVCLNNTAAMDFLLRWKIYVHGVDDIDDGDMPGIEDRNGVFIQALEVYTHPFFMAHWQALKMLVVTLSCEYTDSVLFEKSPVEWQRQESDVIRHSGAQMVLAVAYICAEEVERGSGWKHLRSFSIEQRILCYHQHHQANTPIGKGVE